MKTLREFMSAVRIGAALKDKREKGENCSLQNRWEIQTFRDLKMTRNESK
jgi:hypothetical protein